jgi:ABC-type uncharacterized transport system involved in gliding motility auxiliary subunit
MSDNSQTTQTPPNQNVPPPPLKADDQDSLFLLSLAAGAVGFFLLMCAAAVYFIASTAEPTAQLPEWFDKRNLILAFGTGLFVLGVGLQINRIWDFLYRRRSLYALNVILMSVLAIGLTGLIDYVTARHFHEFDLTKRQFFTISDESIQVAKSIEKNVRIYLIFEGNDADTVSKLVDHYRSKNPKIEVISIDPVLDREKLRSAVKELGLEPRSMEDLLGAIVQVGYLDTKDGVSVWHTDRSKKLSRNDFFEQSFDPQSGGRGAAKFKGEQALTNALIEVSEEKKAKLYFLQGHGELDMEGRGQGDDHQCGDLTRQLRAKNYDVQALNIIDRQQKDIPDDASIVVIAGPQKAFDPQEVGALETYLKNGGKLLAFIGETYKEDTNEWRPLGIEPLLKKYNVEVENKQVQGLVRAIDNGQVVLALRPGAVCDQYDPTSKITQPLTGLRTAFGYARSLKALTENPHAKATEIVKTNQKAPFYEISDPNNPDADLKAEKKSIPLVVSSEQKLEGKPGEKEKVTRLVVAGDATFGSNYLLEQGVNEPLILNSIAWLVGQERFTKEAVKEGDYHLDMSAGLASLFQLIACPGVPFLTILAGITVWIVRRR